MDACFDVDEVQSQCLYTGTASDEYDDLAMSGDADEAFWTVRRTTLGIRRETLTVPEEQRLLIHTELAHFVAAHEAQHRVGILGRKMPPSRKPGKMYKIAIFAPIEHCGQRPPLICEYDCIDPNDSETDDEVELDELSYMASLCTSPRAESMNLMDITPVSRDLRDTSRSNADSRMSEVSNDTFISQMSNSASNVLDDGCVGPARSVGRHETRSEALDEETARANDMNAYGVQVSPAVSSTAVAPSSCHREETKPSLQLHFEQRRPEAPIAVADVHPVSGSSVPSMPGRHEMEDTGSPKSVRFDPGVDHAGKKITAPTRQTVVESKVDALKDELEFIKNRLEAIGDDNSGLSTETSCQTDLALLSDFITNLAMDTRENGEGTDVETQTELFRRQSNSRSRSVQISLPGSDIYRESRNDVELAMDETDVDELVSKASAITNKEEHTEEIELYGSCLAECNEWANCTRIFTTQVRHLGPHGGVEQANLFGARARNRSLLPSTSSMNEWKLWASSYLSTWASPRIVQDDDLDDELKGKFVELDEELVDENGVPLDVNLLKQPIYQEEVEEREWVTVWSPEYLRCYYWNPATDEVTWTEPVEE